MSNNEYIPSEEHLWENVLNKASDQEQIDHRGQGESRNEDPYLLERLQVSGSGNDPELDLDPDSGVLSIEISSNYQCSLHFFGPVLFWVRQYCTRPAAKTILELTTCEMNPFSCIYITRMISLLENIQDKGLHVEVHCITHGNSEVNTMPASALKKHCKLPIRVIENDRT